MQSFSKLINSLNLDLQNNNQVSSLLKFTLLELVKHFHLPIVEIIKIHLFCLSDALSAHSTIKKQLEANIASLEFELMSAKKKLKKITCFYRL